MVKSRNVAFSLRARSPIWASETSLARTRERAAKPRSAPRSRVLARLTSLAHIGELARRLGRLFQAKQDNVDFFSVSSSRN